MAEWILIIVTVISFNGKNHSNIRIEFFDDLKSCEERAEVVEVYMKPDFVSCEERYKYDL